VDLSQQRRSTNVEDERTGAVRELINQLVLPIQSAAGALMTHPFQTSDQYYRDKFANTPTDPAAYSPLAFEAGVGQAAESGKLPLSFHPEGTDAEAVPLWKRILMDMTRVRGGV